MAVAGGLKLSLRELRFLYLLLALLVVDLLVLDHVFDVKVLQQLLLLFGQLRRLVVRRLSGARTFFIGAMSLIKSVIYAGLKLQLLSKV